MSIGIDSEFEDHLPAIDRKLLKVGPKKLATARVKGNSKPEMFGPLGGSTVKVWLTFPKRFGFIPRFRVRMVSASEILCGNGIGSKTIAYLEQQIELAKVS